MTGGDSAQYMAACSQLSPTQQVCAQMVCQALSIRPLAPAGQHSPATGSLIFASTNLRQHSQQSDGPKYSMLLTINALKLGSCNMASLLPSCKRSEPNQGHMLFSTPACVDLNSHHLQYTMTFHHWQYAMTACISSFVFPVAIRLCGALVFHADL